MHRLLWLTWFWLGLAQTGLGAGEMWISREELRALPLASDAWLFVQAAAETPVGEPAIRNPDDTNDVLVLAKALVYARTGDVRYRTEVVAQCLAAMGTEKGGESIGLARNLVCYVIAADLIGLDGSEDARFRSWLVKATQTEVYTDGRTLKQMHEERPNNWGTMAGASRAAVAIYLGDKAELERTAQVFHGWLGDRTAYARFKYGGPDDDLSWQADPGMPVGINPKGALKEGHLIDGALPEEMRRGDRFHWPPSPTGYCWEGLQGAFVLAELLYRQGYPVYTWEDQALLRAVQFLYQLGWVPEGDDQWQVWIINKRYGTEYPTNLQARPGKNMGWTSWAHGPTRGR